MFRGNGPDDFVCVECGNVLAASMDEEHMTYKVRVKCGVCKTINVSATDVHDLVEAQAPALAVGLGPLVGAHGVLEVRLGASGSSTWLSAVASACRRP